MKRFKPSNGEEYHFSTSAGEIGTAVWQDNYSDIQRYLLGNCFRTIKETQAKINNDKAIAAGRVVMVNVPDGYEVDFIRPSEQNSFRWSEVHFKPIPPPPPEVAKIKVLRHKQSGFYNDLLVSKDGEWIRYEAAEEIAKKLEKLRDMFAPLSSTEALTSCNELTSIIDEIRGTNEH